MRVLIANDHVCARQVVGAILTQFSEVGTIGEASDGPQVLRYVDAEPWDLLILDLSLPVLTGFGVLCEVKRRQPQLPVLVLTVQAELPFADRLTQAGAAGCIDKAASRDQLGSAIRQVMRGGRYVSTSLGDRRVDPGVSVSDRDPL